MKNVDITQLFYKKIKIMKLKKKEIQNINELKVNESLNIRLHDIKCVKSKLGNEDLCSNCIFNEILWHDCISINCLPQIRKDKKDVIFIKTN